MKMQYVALSLLVSAPLAEATETLGYGSRAGMEVDIVSRSGLDTTHAVIRTNHSRANATAFCKEYVGKVTASCIKEELSTPLKDNVTADCKAGVFSDFEGKKYHFLGSDPQNNIMAKFRLLDIRAKEVADGSEASGYPTNMAIFHALCPQTAPADF